MPYIYKVTNNINGKIYVGKTLHPVEKRWKEHCQDYKKERYKKRPLYRAMQKYGETNFSIEQLEECSADTLNDREVYWIEKLGSFKYGYNATIGGDGKQFVDVDLIYCLWNNGYNINDIVKKLNYDHKTVKKWLDIFGVDQKEINSRMVKNKIVPVEMLDKNTNEVIQVFSSIA
ncbi:MAG: GIY-YIG nuclease family protein, partial [Bacteroidales bacterium]|nr:GIY-YIG nuclease family protein [Bacteroidales bacterium]